MKKLRIFLLIAAIVFIIVAGLTGAVYMLAICGCGPAPAVNANGKVINSPANR